MNPSIPLLVFTPHVGHKEHLPAHMYFDIGTLQFGLLNCLEEFLSSQPNVSIVDNRLLLVEELFLNS